MSVGVTSGYPQLAENEKDLLLKVYVDFPSSLNASGTLQCVLGANTVRGGFVCSFDLLLHNENMPMQYTEIFKFVKNENFQWKIFAIFLIFAQNIDCGYTLEPPH